MTGSKFASRLGDEMIGDPARVGLVSVTVRDLPELDRLMRDPEEAQWWPDYEIDDFRDYLTHAYVAPFRIVAANATARFEARGVYPGYDGDTMLYMAVER
jgi:hypothetical protein